MKLHKSSLNFLKDLGLNNNKEWFEAHRTIYSSAKTNFKDFVQAVFLGIQEFDKSLKDFDENIRIFRINRDVRFSKDKSPYKRNMAALISKKQGEMGWHGYYFHLEPDNKSGAGGGLVDLDSKTLFKVRKYISDHFDEFTDIFYNKEFNKYFPQFGDKESALKRIPQGFSQTDPSAEFIKNKMFIVWYAINDEDILKDVAYNNIMKAYQVMKPMLDFLQKAIV